MNKITRKSNLNYYAVVGGEMVWAIVVNLADYVDCVAFGIGGNAQGCYRLVGLLNLHFRLANLWLLPVAFAQLALLLPGTISLTIDSISSGSTSAGAISVHTTSRGFKSFSAAWSAFTPITAISTKTNFLIIMIA